jgi:Fe-S cluster assembly ATP-binding protein
MVYFFGFRKTEKRRISEIRVKMAVLKITDLTVSAEDQKILKGLNLEVPQGEVHAIMGPNGTGKSTLAYAIMGHPR